MIFQRDVIEELQVPLEITYDIAIRLLKKKGLPQFSKLSKFFSAIKTLVSVFMMWLTI